MAAPKGNLFALGNNGGRPRIYETPEELEAKMMEYFEDAVKNKYDLTVTGLALFLGFNSRNMLYEYKNRKEFSGIISRGLLSVECGYEHGLHTFRSSGSIFALKNMGWKDQQDQNITQTITTVNPQVVNVDTPLSGSESDIKE